MKTTNEIRYDNLHELVTKAAGDSADLGKGLSQLVQEAAKRGKKLSRPTLYQILNGIRTSGGAIRNVGDDLARDIEDALKLERGWMDNPREMVVSNPQPSGIKAEVLAELILLIDKMAIDVQEMLLVSARNLVSTQEGGGGAVVGNEAK